MANPSSEQVVAPVLLRVGGKEKTMPYLYGIHDQEGAHLLPTGGWCVALVSLSENPNPVDYLSIRPDINWLVRINWGYGSTGTIPLDKDEGEYLNRLGRFISGSKGVNCISIGNEPNHQQERPDGVFITPERYADFFNKANALVNRINSFIRVAPAPIAPYHADPVPWTDYMRQVWSLVKNPTAIWVHAYARSHTPEAINSTEEMGGVLSGTSNSFLTYRDAFNQIPEHHRSLPAWITEFNPLPQWENVNNGTVQEAYEHINLWNTLGARPSIRGLALYRYPNYDRWGIEANAGVLADFRTATQSHLESPEINDIPSSGMDVLLPSIKAPQNASISFQRDLDERAKARGVTVQEVPEGVAWRVKKVRWLDEAQSGGRHNIFVDVLDETGHRVQGVPVVFSWPTGADKKPIDKKAGEPFGVDFPMSPSRNEFSVRVLSDIPSEVVTGIGMGADTPSGFNPGIHTSTEVIFQLVKPTVSQLPLEKSEVAVAVPNLAHPVLDADRRRVTQRYGRGVNADHYHRFGLEGHNGVDFATPTGTEIVAVDEGTAVEVRNDPEGYGNYIKLIHPWGESLYAHLDRFRINQGQMVRKGQIIGLSGNTGNSTGPHLHFALRVNPYRRDDGMLGFTDPLPYLQSLHPVQPEKIGAIIKEVALREGIDWRLLASIAWAESSFNPTVNKDGLFQIEEDTWNDIAPKAGLNNRLDPTQNAIAACIYLKWLLDKVDNNIYKAVLAYNFGIGNVLAGREAPAISKEYVNKVFHGRDLLVALGYK